jgi:hypothetical protein
MDATTKRVKGRDAMIAAFEGIQLDKPITTMCSAGNFLLDHERLGGHTFPLLYKVELADY